MAHGRTWVIHLGHLREPFTHMVATSILGSWNKWTSWFCCISGNCLSRGVSTPLIIHITSNAAHPRVYGLPASSYLPLEEVASPCSRPGFNSLGSFFLLPSPSSLTCSPSSAWLASRGPWHQYLHHSPTALSLHSLLTTALNYVTLHALSFLLYQSWMSFPMLIINSILSTYMKHCSKHFTYINSFNLE